jgi:plastocyanin
MCALVVAAVLFVACSDDEEKVEGGPTVEVPQDTAPAPSPGLQPQPEPVQPLIPEALPAVDGIIAIEARDVLFAPNRWSATLGETVTIRVANADQQEHNLRFAGLDGDYETDDDALIAPDPIAPGEIGELNFVPQVAGNYTFRCDFHPGSMGGRVEVK